VLSNAGRQRSLACGIEPVEDRVEDTSSAESCCRTEALVHASREASRADRWRTLFAGDETP
jgi:hypothetical protein